MLPIIHKFTPSLCLNHAFSDLRNWLQILLEGKESYNSTVAAITMLRTQHDFNMFIWEAAPASRAFGNTKFFTENQTCNTNAAAET